jgi:hypothetical protein
VELRARLPILTRPARPARRARLAHSALIAFLAFIAALPIAAPDAQAKLYRTREQALEHVFGTEAQLRPRTVYLTPAQVDSVRELARAPFDTPRLTYWEASAGDSLLGRAYLDTHLVRSMFETVLVAVAPAGEVRAVDILAFHEPEDYLPPGRWLEKLLGRTLSERLAPGDDVDAISGATLSVRAVTGTVRRVLALDRLLHEEAP